MTNKIQILEEKQQKMISKLETLREKMETSYDSFYKAPDDKTYLKLHRLNGLIIDTIGQIYVLDRAIESERNDNHD